MTGGLPPGPPVAPRARLLDLLSIGLSVPFAIAGGGLLGWLADRWLGTSPWLFLLFLCFGIAAGIRNLISAAGRAAVTAEEASPDEDPSP